MDVYAIDKILAVEPVRPLSQFVLRREGRLASREWLFCPRQFYSTSVVPGQRGAEPYPWWALPISTLTVVGRDVAFEGNRLLLVSSGLAVLVRQGQEAGRVVRVVRVIGE